MADQEVVAALEAALTEVARQLAEEVPTAEILDDGADLGWNFDGPGGWSIYVEGVRRPATSGERDVDVHAYASRWFRRTVARTRTVTIPLDRD